MKGVALDEATGITLSASDALRGEFWSPVFETAFPFSNVVLSWNADAPGNGLVRLEVRVGGEGNWSRWYGLGEWGTAGGRSLGSQADALGRVDVDTLKLTSPATALQYRAILERSDGGPSPLLKQLSVAYSDLSKAPSGPPVERAAAGRDLQVPRISQLEQDPAIAGQICSATSLAMVMQYWGSDRSIGEVIQGVKDRATGIFGNWPLNTAYAGANGFRARVDRFYSIGQVEQEIAAGRPVIISIAFQPGELDGSPIRSTDGHLIVVRGFTEAGDVIVNDPIAPNSGSVRLVYKRGQLEKIWLRSGGIAYLLAPDDGVHAG